MILTTKKAAHIAKFAEFVWFVWLCSNVQTVDVRRRKQAEGTLNKAAFAGLELLQALSPSPFLQSRRNRGCQRGQVRPSTLQFFATM